MVRIFVPVRMNSTRLPGKPLIEILGKTILERCCESIVASGYSPIVLAPDEQIIDFCTAHHIDVLRTSSDCRNGTERVAEACKILDLPLNEVVVNCQGDMFGWRNPAFLSTPIQAVEADARIIATVYSTHFPLLDIIYEDTVKVLGRTPARTEPYFRFTRDTTRYILPTLLGVHFGVYVATRAMFQWYANMPVKDCELEERLEQLRWPANDILAIATEEYPIKIDTPEDLVKAELLLMEEKYGTFDDPV